ncbi:MAG: hypothetical protein MUE47_01310 [Acidobacteria bacterium]|jgi:hypothetical protein|nr:hypothetical protein [Acidobacteriota bacterium]
MRTRIARFALVGIVLVVAVGAALAQSPVTKLRIEVDGKADGNGYINFTFTPATGEAKVVQVPVTDRDREETISEGIAKAFKVALGEAYRVDTRGDDEVKVEARDKKNAFSIAVTDLSVRGVSVKLK